MTTVREIIDHPPFLVAVSSNLGVEEFAFLLAGEDHPAVDGRIDENARVFAFWWAGDGGHMHVHLYRRIEEDDGFAIIHGYDQAFVVSTPPLAPHWRILDEYMQTEEYRRLRDSGKLDHIFRANLIDAIPPEEPPRKPYQIMLEAALREGSPKGIYLDTIGAWAFNDDELAHYRLTTGDYEPLGHVLARFTPREVIDWWLDKKDYTFRSLQIQPILARSAMEAAWIAALRSALRDGQR